MNIYPTRKKTELTYLLAKNMYKSVNIKSLPNWVPYRNRV